MLFRQDKKYHDILPIQFVFWLFNICFDISYPSLSLSELWVSQIYRNVRIRDWYLALIGHDISTPFLELHTDPTVVHHHKAGVGGYW